MGAWAKKRYAIFSEKDPRHWRRRWCVLRRNRLTYYADEQDENKGIPVGEIPIGKKARLVPFKSWDAPHDVAAKCGDRKNGFVFDAGVADAPRDSLLCPLFYFDAETDKGLD